MRTKPPTPVCKDLPTWLQANLGDRCLAPLTGTDTKALSAVAHILLLYSYDRSPEVLNAFALVVMRMQPHCQQFAYHAIAHAMNWEDRAVLWNEAELPPLDPPTARCKFEP